MAKTATLKAEERKRTGSGVLKQMRREGWVPSIVYGGGVENRNLKINSKTFRDLVAHSASENFLVDLEIEGAGNQLAFVQDIQHDPLSGDIIHADFRAVDEKTEIKASLPIVLEGEAKGVKAGGLLEQHLHYLEISCLPKDLPESLHADVSDLGLTEAFSVSDMTLPEGVSTVADGNIVVAIVAKTRTLKSAGGGVEGEEGEEAAAE
ncbi:MAG: 50S ribosomal protein L25 [Verrucomicrobiota bacterium JB023]|nr:50S ribosomal protein L25 [Verrucomicrobiota bacterium JB023]